MTEGFPLDIKRIGQKAAACMLACALALFCPVFPQKAASADTVSEAQAALSSAEAQMQAISAEYDALAAEIEELQGRIDATAAEAMAAQQAVLAGRDRLSETVVYDYRSGLTLSMLTLLLESGSFDELLDNIEYLQQLMEYQAAEIQAQKDRKAAFDAVAAKLDEQKAAQVEALAALAEKQAQAEAVVAEASAKLANAEAEEAARLAALQEAASQMQQAANAGGSGGGGEVSEDANTTDREEVVPDGTPVQPNPDDGDGEADGSQSGWLSGIASAYGGVSDPSTPNPGTTATGAICDDNSMGVAVPMSMPGYRTYFGRTVEISYNGMTVYAVVNDCGYMGNGSRVLDLQPGVWKAFGYSTCRAWGLRMVNYRFL